MAGPTTDSSLPERREKQRVGKRREGKTERQIRKTDQRYRSEREIREREREKET